jgi:predicted ATPase
LWELRAAHSYALLLRDQGKHAEARALLAPVYGWFTEGFATAPLREAKALLDELGAAQSEEEEPRRQPPPASVAAQH